MSCAKRYAALETDRNYYLERARSAARLTLPYLIPVSDDPATMGPETWRLPWNGIGARGVHNLASRLLIALLPPTESFFRFTVDEMSRAKIEKDMLEQGLSGEEIAKRWSEQELALARMERAVLRSIETSNDRVAVHEMLLHLVVGGNVLQYVGEDGLQCFHLNRYVCRRDPIGNPLEAITCEALSVESLPAAAKAVLEESDGEIEGIADGDDDEQPEYERVVKVYTHVEWDWAKDKVSWYQEIKDQEIPGSSHSTKISNSPWLPLRMFRIDGQAYSPGYVEAACMADLQTAEALNQAIAEGSLVSAQVKHLVKPAGVANAKQLADSANGAYLPGNPEDVFTIQVNKAADLSVAAQGLARIEARLAQAFMLADVRDSERTTAEEVRLQALQIENSLGSIYAILTTEFQQPYVARKLELLVRANKLPKVPDDLIKPVVSVGLAAVGRGNDLEKTARFMQILQQSLGPEGITTYVMPSELIRRLASAMGMDILGLVKTEEQLAKEQQAQQQAAMAQQAMAAGMADPQKLANAAATTAEMAAP
ncbi:MAG: portal protein, partial [Synechococcaceae cyanobacterium]|nr:portal protein [Synechococcaceae cyanobacterium]